MKIPLSEQLAKLQGMLPGLRNRPVLASCKAASLRDAQGRTPQAWRGWDRQSSSQEVLLGQERSSKL